MSESTREVTGDIVVQDNIAGGGGDDDEDDDEDDEEDDEEDDDLADQAASSQIARRARSRWSRPDSQGGLLGIRRHARDSVDLTALCWQAFAHEHTVLPALRMNARDPAFLAEQKRHLGDLVRAMTGRGRERRSRRQRF